MAGPSRAVGPCGIGWGDKFKHREKKRGAKVTRCRRKNRGWAEQQWGDGRPSVPGSSKSRGRRPQPTGPGRLFQEEKKSKEKWAYYHFRKLKPKAF